MSRCPTSPSTTTMTQVSRHPLTSRAMTSRLYTESASLTNQPYAIVCLWPSTAVRNDGVTATATTAEELIMPVLRFCLDHHIKAAQLLLPLSAAFGHTSAGQVEICRRHNSHSSSGHSTAF